MTKGLVSIIAPCYNKDNVCGRFIQSVIDQTYRPIELIIINDGSTDNSEEVVLSYQDQVEKNGIKFKYILKENEGLGAAINTGLEHVEGEFICWPDTDDWYEPTATEEKVKYLQANDDKAIVSTNAYIIYENALQDRNKVVNSNETRANESNQFFLLLQGQSDLCSGMHMVRSEELFSALNGRKIYPSRHGQNFQLLLPMYYHYKRGYINKPLYCYVVYADSMSHHKRDFKETIAHREQIIDIKHHAIDGVYGISDEDRKKAYAIVDSMEHRIRLSICYQYHEVSYGVSQYEWLKSNSFLLNEDKRVFLRLKYPFYDKMYSHITNLKNGIYRTLKSNRR